MIVTFTATSLFSLGTLLISTTWIPAEYVMEIWFAALTVPAMSALILTCLIELIAHNEENERRLFKEEKLKAIEQMGAAISHDIRNPLTAAIGFTELLSSDSINQESRKHFTSILKTEIEHAEQILQNYLNFTKPATLSFTNVSIDNELNKVVQMLQPLANLHSIKIETNLISKGTIIIDRQKFNESVTAFIQHSLLTMEPGGTLVISSSLSKTKVIIRLDIHEVALLGKNYLEKSLNEQNALLSSMHTIKAMKGMIESKTTPIGHTFLLTFKKG
ncbi:histidine kinase dimerization/phospho-acceptor domain-containing protein [Chungangia koreensis]